MADGAQIFAWAEEAVRETWWEFRTDEDWRTLQPAQAGMDQDSWLAMSSRMIRRFNVLSGDFCNVTLSREARKSYLGKELGEFVILLEDVAGQMP